jgi:hypothetical protein
VQLTSPLELFDCLDKSKSTIKNLRNAQKEILQKYWEGLKDYPRIGIRLPTGSGKSLIAILILEAHRQAGRNVAILTANKGLAEDMKRRCDEFNIPSATIFGTEEEPSYRMIRTRNLTMYKRKQIIGIFNYHSYLYGTEYKQEIFPPDVLVVDDASDFETVRNDFFCILIEKYRHKDLYNAILNELQPCSTIYPNLTAFVNETARPNSMELIYFVHSERIMQILQSHYREFADDITLKLSYDRNRDRSSSFLVFITGYEIEIRPLIIPEECLKMYNIQQTIFMSATLPERELLQKMFGIRSDIAILDESALSREAFQEIETLGKRLIFPIDQAGLGERVSSVSLGMILELFSIKRKLLILVNSVSDARSIFNFLTKEGISTTFYTSSEDSERFAKSSEGVLVCANRYFGLDFPGDACKVAVIVRLPMIWDSIDNFQFSTIGNAIYSEQRIGNRLTQSFGRCNRLITDEALYFILDPRVISRITGEEQYLSYLPRSMFAELMVGYYVSEGGNLSRAMDYGKNWFFGKADKQLEDWLDKEKKRWQPRQFKSFVSKYDREIEAWACSINGNYTEAGQLYDYVADDYRQNIEKFGDENLTLLSAWNFYLSAMNYYNAFLRYRNPKDKESCMSALKTAIQLGGNNSWFNNLRYVYNELVEKDADKLEYNIEKIEARRIKEQIVLEFDRYINMNSSRRRNWKDSFFQLKKDISQGSHGQMVDGLILIFAMLGYKARKGDNSKGEPDIIANSSMTSQKYQLVIEAKTLKEGTEESSSSVTQVMGDKGVVERASLDYYTFAILITQKETFSPKAVEIAKQQVQLIKVSEFNILMDFLYDRLDKWSSLSTPHQKFYFIDSIVSPYELQKMFIPSDRPIVMSSQIKEAIEKTR